MTASRVLVVGGDSLIGRAMADRLSDLGRKITVTTRRKKSNRTPCIAFDLSQPPNTWPPMPEADTWVICAGITKGSQCRSDPIGSSHINVEATTNLAQAAARANAQVIFLSTNQVFDGTVPHRLAEDTRCPISEYGRQKAEAERRVLDSAAASSVVRLTKVLEPRFGLLKDWIRDLGKGQLIDSFSDMFMSPVPLGQAVDILLTIMDKRLTGIFQVSGQIDISYTNVATHLARRLGVDPELVHPINAADAHVPPEETPRHTTLNADRVTMETGIRIPDAFDVIDQVFQLQPPLTTAEKCSK